jgi:hypothetical protein
MSVGRRPRDSYNVLAEQFGWDLGGQAGALLGSELGLPSDRMTMLRILGSVRTQKEAWHEERWGGMFIPTGCATRCVFD